MRMPAQDDYGLTQEDIEWCKTRETEIDELSYKKFVNKIWIWIIPISALGFAFRCSQVPWCHLDSGILIDTAKILLFVGIFSYWPALLFGIIAKWVYVFSAKRDDRLQSFQRFKQEIARYNAVPDEDIVSDYGDFIREYYRLDIIWDVSKLPHPKERIMNALIRLNAKETTSDEQKKAIAVTFINLSQFQEGVGEKDLCMLRNEYSKLIEDHESGKITSDQFQSLMKLERDEAGKEKLVYDKFNALVVKEMNETLPKKLIEGTAKILLDRAKATG
jgi:hypothetical protein